MRAHYVALLGAALAVLTPAAAESADHTYTVKELQALARSAHPTLESARAALEAAEGGLRQSRARANPELSVGFGRGRPRDGGDSRAESMIELVQPIELPGLRRWRKRAAELGIDAAELDRHLAETVIDSTVAQLANTALFAQRLAGIAAEGEEVALRLRRLLERRVELGESSPLEELKARSEWFARRREVLRANRLVQAARSALAAICGRRLPPEFALADRLGDLPLAPLPDDLAGRLRSQNPLLLRAETAVRQATAQTEIARKANVPRIDLFAGHDTELDRTASSIGVGFTIPLWNRNRGAVVAAAAEQNRAAADLSGVTLELETALEQARVDHESALAALRLHEGGWTDAARRALEIASFSFDNGEASLLDVLDAQRSYLVVRLAEAESRAALARAITEIERLVAGDLIPEDSDDNR